MTVAPFPENVRKFIYDFVDSVSVLEAMILVSSPVRKPWTAEALSAEMRSSPTSAEHCLSTLRRIGVVQESPGKKNEFFYSPKNPEFVEIIAALPGLYQSRPQHMLELIFSPLKQARIISDGFRVSSKRTKPGDNNG